MATRYTAKPKPRFGVPGLASGFDNVSTPSSLTIPSVGLEDVDVSLFNLFNEEMNLAVSDKDGIKRVPVIFAAGEKWAMLKRGNALRDKAGSLILPLLTIVRTNIQQNAQEDQAGRGINQQQGEIVIKRRLSNSDREYQSLINRLLLKNQENLAVSDEDSPVLNQVTTRRDVGDMAQDPTVSSGGLLAPNRTNNVTEVIVLPAPQFFTATYEVTIWTSYTTQMNQVLETLISSFLPQGNAWRLETKKGYWFIATVDGNLFSPDNNADDMSQGERLIKYKFNIKVPGYILASKSPGTPVPIRRYVSSPSISFGISTAGPTGVEDPFLGADDPTLPLSAERSRRADQRNDGSTRLYPGKNSNPHDPARASLSRGTEPVRYRKIVGVDSNGQEVVKMVRVKSVNSHNGEMVYSSTFDLSDMSIIMVDD